MKLRPVLLMLAVAWAFFALAYYYRANGRWQAPVETVVRLVTGSAAP